MRYSKPQLEELGSVLQLTNSVAGSMVGSMDDSLCPDGFVLSADGGSCIQIFGDDDVFFVDGDDDLDDQA